MEVMNTSLKNYIISERDRAGNAHASIAKARKACKEIFEAKGFPSKKDEEWKYTSLRSVLAAAYNNGLERKQPEVEDLAPYILLNEASRIVFVDGVYSEELSDIVPENGVAIQTLKSALNEGNPLVLEHFAAIADTQDAMTALNIAVAEEGVIVDVSKNTLAERALELLYISTGDNFSQLHNIIVIGDNAAMKVVESHVNLGEEKVFSNHLTEVKVGENAQYRHYKLQNDKDSAALVDNTYVDQHRYSKAVVDTFSFNGELIRNNLNFYLKGQYSEANMYGITFLDGDQHVDNHTLVDHIAPHCDSNELFKGIYDGNSVGVFNGKVMVRQEAQKTNGFQANNNILLSDTAKINTKPQLEIFADDVRCSHGCTIGQLDEDGMFYLQSRGIPRKEAKAMLMYAFSNEALDNVEIPELRKKLNGLIAAKLGVELDFELELED